MSDMTLRYWGGPFDGQPVPTEVATQTPVKVYQRGEDGRVSHLLDPAMNAHGWHVIGEYIYTKRDPLRITWRVLGAHPNLR